MEKEHCCARMQEEIVSRFIRYRDETKLYSIHSGQNYYLVIDWCPFCGMYLRGNKDAISKKQK